MLLTGNVVISEFMAANQTTLTDGFRATSDWIELWNAGDSPADLTGHALTNDPDNLSKWRFPDGTELAAGQYLLVFASGFDTVDPDGDLHASFRLDAGGAYLALADANLQVLSEYGEAGADYPDQFADVSYGMRGVGGAVVEPAVGFLAEPSPRAPNSVDLLNDGPLIVDVTRQPGALDDEQNLVVTAQVQAQGPAVGAVQLIYRVMYDEEVTLSMRDDGTSGDLVAGDGLFTAVIPHEASSAGQMVRWYVTAADDSGRVAREPAFLDQVGTDQSPEYDGTVIADPEAVNQLPVLEWFLAPGTENRANTTAGTRASVFYGGEFYDNVFVRLRGGTSASLPKKSYKFDFNTAHSFRFHPDHGRVREINLNTTYTNKDYIRQALAYETYDLVGAPGSIAFPMRVQRNGEFFSVAMFVEQPDEDLLNREGLDPDGALYKMYNKFDSGTSGFEKKTRTYENSSDLAEFVREINNRSGEELGRYVFDHVNIPAVLNYLAGTVIEQNNDQSTKNYYLYRDTNGSGEWMFLPWDLDLVFGLHFMSNDSILDDEIWADKDNFQTSAGVTIWPSHPFVGDEEHPGNRNWNRLIDALYEVPLFREMYLRRLRTVMDELLQAPDTPVAERKFETRLDEYQQQVAPDAQLDYEEWANPWRWGEDLSLAEAIQRIKDEYLTVRRDHLYRTHSIDRLNQAEPTVLVPEFAMARYFVPTNDALGTSWTAAQFDDSSWAAGPTGVGFEDNPGAYTDLLKSRAKPAEAAADATSVLVRIPFQVEDPSQIEDLTLRMKYDDGFVAYLNGTEVARGRLRTEGPQSYNSLGRARSNSTSAEFEDYLISDFVDQLQAGENVLAIHVVNGSVTSNDLLVLPELLNGRLSNSDIAGIPHAQADDVSLSFGSVIDFDPSSGNQDEEYFTVVNPNDTAVDISGWRVEGSAHLEFVAGTVIGAGQSLFLSPDVNAFRARTEGPAGNQGLFVQSYEGYLSNRGDTLRLLNPSGQVVAEATYQGSEISAQHALRISEVHYNPYPAMPQFGELDTDNDSYEFVEIVNTGTTTVDLSGVQIVELEIDDDTQGIGFTFAEGQLDPGGYVVVAKSEAAFRSRYGMDARVAGEFSGKLSNGGEILTLWDAASDVIQQFRYNDAGGWPERADGDGSSLELIDPMADAALTENWRASAQFGGSPGSVGEEFDEIIVINEVLSRSTAPSVDQIELFNQGSQTVDLSGWYLSDGNNYFKFRIPAEAAMLGPGEYRVFDEAALGFGFKGSEPDDAWLVAADSTGKPTHFVDHVEFPAAMGDGVSFGRWRNGVGPLVPMVNNSFGQTNAGPLAGDLNGDERVTAADIDWLYAELRKDQPDPNADLNGDGLFDAEDRTELIEQILQTTFGDANLDGIFDTADIVQILQAGQYEDAIEDNSSWASGDWDGDGDFTTNDLVLALQRGSYRG